MCASIAPAYVQYAILIGLLSETSIAKKAKNKIKNAIVSQRISSSHWIVSDDEWIWS